MSTSPHWTDLLLPIKAIFAGATAATKFHFEARPVSTEEHLRRCKDFAVLAGPLPPGAIFPSGSFVLVADPLLAGIKEVVRSNAEILETCAREAWTVLPVHVRAKAMGGDGETGWFLLVYHLLQQTGSGLVSCTEELARIDRDMSRASVWAIDMLVLEARGKPAKPKKKREPRIPQLLLALLQTDRQNANKSMTELAEQLHCDKSTVSRAFDHPEYGPLIKEQYHDYGVEPPTIHDV